MEIDYPGANQTSDSAVLASTDPCLRIGLVQMRCEKAAVTSNLEGISRHLKEAVAHGVQILAFPEMSITGYADPNRYPEAVIQLDGPEVGRLLEITAGHQVTVLVGLIEANAGGKPFITQIVVCDGVLAGAYRKVTIKDEEAEWFAPGSAVPVFQSGDLTYGLAICADIGNSTLYADLAQQGVQIVFELAAPGLYGDQAARNWQSGFVWWREECETYLSVYAREHDMWIAVATQAGRTVDEDFPGGGFVYAPGGRCVFATPDWRPGAAYLELDMQNHRLRHFVGAS